MRAQEFITEATYELDADVDLLYDKAFADIVENIRNGTWDGQMPPKFLGTTAILTSPEAQEADKINRLKIITSSGNYYQPHNQILSISLNEQALEIIKKFGGLKQAIHEVPLRQRNQFMADLTPDRVKGSIHHELSHWLDDTLHGSHIKNRIDRAVAAERNGKYDLAQRIMHQGKKEVGLTNYELNAQIHSIKQLKRANMDMWNILSFDEMVDMNASLIHLRTLMKEIDEYDNWKKIILKRMHREKLLGDEMSRTY